MDLALLDTTRGSEEGMLIQLRHPKTLEHLDVHIRVAGPDSRAAITISHAQLARRREDLAKARRTWRVPAEVEADDIELLAACTLAWEGVTIEGTEWPCTAENARKLYERFRWIRGQIEEVFADRGNFVPGSASS